MKTTAISVRYFFSRIFLLVFLSVNILATQAQDSIKAPAAEIKYIGELGDKLLFEVSYSNYDQSPFTLQIEDHQGYRFYFGRFRSRNFNKRFAIDKSEAEGTSLQFLLVKSGEVQEQTFNISFSSRIVKDVSVVKL